MRSDAVQREAEEFWRQIGTWRSWKVDIIEDSPRRFHIRITGVSPQVLKRNRLQRLYSRVEGVS